MDNAQPTNPSGMQILWKLIIGVILGVLLSIVILLIFAWLGGTIDLALKNAGHDTPFSPLVWLSFMGIALLSSILGTILTAIVYNILWQEDYYDVKIMSSGILTANLLMLFIFLLFYLYVGSILSDITTLFLVYGFHLFFSIFVSFIVIDIVKNPSYSSVYVIGNSFGFIIALLIFFIIYSSYQTKAGTDIKNILFFPPILSLTLIPVISSIWEKLYYKFYEMGNDFLYIPAITEVLVDEEEEDEVNVTI